jgi:hypothetical protein
MPVTGNSDMPPLNKYSLRVSFGLISHTTRSKVVIRLDLRSVELLDPDPGLDPGVKIAL